MLTEEVNRGLYIIHILVGNFDLYDCCHLNAQAARRMRDLPFARYYLKNKTEYEEFATALRTFLEEVPLKVDVDGLLKHWRWFGEWSLGCIGVLGDWLVETVEDLFKRGETTLTIDALKRHALQPDQRARMEIEAQTGERKVELAKTKGEEDLKRLLGNPAPLPGTLPSNQAANGASDLSASSEGAVSAGSKTRIERAATRDLVGDQVQTVKTPKCPFPGEVSIEAKRFLESGVKLVECPDCLRTRSLSPHNGVIRFPSHDKRKTRTPNTDQRWVMGETAWDMVGG
jgi:hypothetical protein